MFFRLIVLFFAIATLMLSVWALIGSYKNVSYVTDNYLIGFQLTGLNMSAILHTLGFAKRDVIDVVIEAPTPTTNPYVTQLPQKRLVDASQWASIASANSGVLAALTNANTATTGPAPTKILSEIAAFASTASVVDAVVTLAADLAADPDLVVKEIISDLNHLDLGLSDFYSVGFWGYCKGNVGSNVTWLDNLGQFGKAFNNRNVNFTYCSPAKAGFRFDPLEVLKHEMENAITGTIEGSGVLPAILTDTEKAELLVLVSSITYDDLGLPGDLHSNMSTLNSVTVAAFALILAGAVLAFISIVFQVLGVVISQNHTILSVLNFSLMVIVFLVVLVGSAMSTGVYMYVRGQVNDNIDDFGVKSFLSVQFYAFLWSSVAAALLMCVLSFLGYCCGCFHSGKRRYRNARHEPAMAYDHKAGPGYESD